MAEPSYSDRLALAVCGSTLPWCCLAPCDQCRRRAAAVPLAQDLGQLAGHGGRLAAADWLDGVGCQPSAPVTMALEQP